MRYLRSFTSLTAVSVPVAALTAYFGGIAVWGRNDPWVPFALAARLPWRFGPAMYGSTVALLVTSAVCASVTAVWWMWGALALRRAVVLGMCVGLGFGVGVLVFHSVRGSFVDSIPGYTAQAWSILVGCGLVGIAGGALLLQTAGRVTSGHEGVTA